MLPETPALLLLRQAVRRWLDAHPYDDVAIALSGGADSLALTAAAVAETDRVAVCATAPEPCCSR